jgi:hypothetical protein
LHLGGQFVRANACFEPRIVRPLLLVVAIQLIQQRESLLVAGLRHEVGTARQQIFDRILALRKNRRALRVRGQKGGTPILRPVRCKAAMIRQNNKRRQVVRQAAQAVTDPCSHSRKARILETSRLQISRLAVDARLADHVVNERHVVDTLAQRRDRLADHLAGLAVGTEFERRLHPRPEPILKRLDMLAKVRRLAMMLFESRLMIEQIDMTCGTTHEQLHDARRLGGMMEDLHDAAGANIPHIVRRDRVVR